MKQFANHAAYCSACAYPYDTYMRGGQLCQYGHGYAKDVAQYIYSKSGRAFSTVDRQEDDARVQIEIPRDCDVIYDLLKAVDKGMRLPKHKPVVYQQVVEPVYTRKQAPQTTQYFEIEERSPVRTKTSPVLSSSRPQLIESRSKIYIKGRGSLYKKDISERRRREEEEGPIIIAAAPGKPRVREYYR